MNNYYVYVYIDPRDFSEFYYGKGSGRRKFAHLNDGSDSEKSRVIKEIHDEGLSPIIRVIAKGLTEEQAFLIEKTLIWKLGRNLTNISSGHFKDKFRPHKTFHKEVYGFDFTNGIYFFNCGDSKDNYRFWEDFRSFNFITAGGHPKYSDSIRSFLIGDIACVFLSGHGYVGVCKITAEAVPAKEFFIDHNGMNRFSVRGNYLNELDNENCEYICSVEWLASNDRNNFLWDKNANMFATPQVKASMQKQGDTIKRIESFFKLDILALLE